MKKKLIALSFLPSFLVDLQTEFLWHSEVI